MTPEEDIQIPERLAEGLRGLHEGPKAAPSMDEQVMAAARRELAPRPIVLRPLTWVAAAAAIALGVTVWMVMSPAPPSARTPVFAKEDVDANGRIDMVDAFKIARAVDRGLPTEPSWDLNEDGVVDRADADLAAVISVRLEGETS